MSSKVMVRLPDGSTKELEEGATGADLAASIGSRLAKDALAITVDGAEADLTSVLPDGATIEILTPDFLRKPVAAAEQVIDARADVFNHNLETVPRLYLSIRPGARYYHSLRLLERVKEHVPLFASRIDALIARTASTVAEHPVIATVAVPATGH